MRRDFAAASQGTDASDGEAEAAGTIYIDMAQSQTGADEITSSFPDNAMLTDTSIDAGESFESSPKLVDYEKQLINVNIDILRNTCVLRGLIVV